MCAVWRSGLEHEWLGPGALKPRRRQASSANSEHFQLPKHSLGLRTLSELLTPGLAHEMSATLPIFIFLVWPKHEGSICPVQCREPRLVAQPWMGSVALRRTPWPSATLIGPVNTVLQTPRPVDQDGLIRRPRPSLSPLSSCYTPSNWPLTVRASAHTRVSRPCPDPSVRSSDSENDKLSPWKAKDGAASQVSAWYRLEIFQQHPYDLVGRPIRSGKVPISPPVQQQHPPERKAHTVLSVSP